MHNFLLGASNNAILEPKLKRISRATTLQFNTFSNSSISESEIATQDAAIKKDENSIVFKLMGPSRESPATKFN
ncbi:hypothetical protein LguiA_022487 [Lonicera macranthoides]